MKKLSTYLFLILFSFQTSSWADDIRDFQIEGISIGDSALDFFSKEKLEISRVNDRNLKNTKYSKSCFNNYGNSYDRLCIAYKKNIISNITEIRNCAATA